MKITRWICAILALVMVAAFFGCDARESVGSEREETTAHEGFEPIDESEQQPPEEREPVDLSLEAITEGLGFDVTEELIITRPEGNIETAAENYYITGVSDPALPLQMNGITVESRGEFGSFGAYVPLDIGENRFRFSQDEIEEILIITRLEYEDYALTDTITGARPSADVAVRSGEPITLTCVAPAGATVTATVGETTLEMTQTADTDVENLPVTFSAAFDPGEILGTAELGPVTYIMSEGGSTVSVSSPGRIFAVAAEDELIVRVNETAVAVFAEESDESGFYTTLKKGAVDRVDEISYDTYDEMYRLASGGWIFKRRVEPLTAKTPYESEVGAITFAGGEQLETVTFEGTATPPYSAEVKDGILSLTLHHTTLGTELELSGSEIVSETAAREENGDTTIDFTLNGDVYWGYLVQYDGDDTVLTLKKRPRIEAAEWPLDGVTVALDPGHGGTDNGAAGVALNDGAMEKDVNLAAAIATQRYLEGLGATVIMTRKGDEKLDLDAILAFNEAEQPDFFLSLHSNSLSYASDGTEPSGVEIFYYEDSDEALATTLAALITDRTARVNREAKQDYYKVTLDSLGRSLLIEMGFLTNPVEYDALRSMDGVYEMATAIGDGLVAYLSEPETIEVEEEAA